MKHNNRFLHFFVGLPLIVCFISTPFLTSCGGGGSEVSDNSDLSPSPVVKSESVPDQLNSQNDKAAEYFTKYKQLIETAASVDERLFWVDYSETYEMEDIVNDVEENYILAQEITDIGDEIYAIEQKLQNNISTFSFDTAERMRTVKPQGAAIILGVCAVGLTTAAFASSQHDSLQRTWKAKKECGDAYKAQLEEDRNAGYPQDTLDNLNKISYEEYLLCNTMAETDFYEKYYEDVVGGFVSVVGPDKIPLRFGRVFFKAFSAAWDTTTIYVTGRQSGSDNATPQAVNDDDSSTMTFSASFDETEPVSVPEGEWDIIVFKPGQARFGTPEGYTLSVREGQTTYIEYSTVPTNTASTSDFQNCESNSEPITEGCTTDPDIEIGKEGKYYFVKGFYYPMPDFSSCYTSDQIQSFIENGDTVIEDKNRGSCTICPSGYLLKDYEGVETCISCPEDTYYSDGCCN
mgnify:CR=1 FL=1